MALFKKISSGILCKAGIFGAGVLGVYLWRKRRLPRYMGIISMGATSLGLCSALWYIWKGEDTPKQDSYNAECKEIVDALYREVVAQGEKQASQRGSEDGIEEKEGELQIVNGNEEPAVADQSESKLPAVPNEANFASAVGSSLRACAASFSQNDISEADASKVDELAAEVSKDPVLEDGANKELAREFATEELDAKAEKTEDVCRKEGADGSSTPDSSEGEVFHDAEEFKLPDTQKDCTLSEAAVRIILRYTALRKGLAKKRHN